MDSAQAHITPAAQHVECLVREHYAYIQRLALSILDDPDEAEDAAQETFIAAHRAWSSFRGEAQARTWLTTIAVNACRGRLRKRKVRQALHATLTSLHLLSARPPSPEQAALQSETDRQLWQAVDSLDEKHRLPLILRYVHELSVPQIAAVLNLSQGTVHSRLHYARLKLQHALGGPDALLGRGDESNEHEKEESNETSD
jgi:RNA polymerase sigma-70 factor (ECF subfamily)